MVLEALLTVSGAKKNPIGMFVLSFLLSSIALWISYYTFPGSASILALSFLTIGLMPVMHRLFLAEEESEVECPGWCGSFLVRHFHVIMIYAFFFVGIVVSYAFWYAVLPDIAPVNCGAGAVDVAGCSMPVRESVFAEQEKTWAGINALRASATANVVAYVTGNSASSCLGGGRTVVGCTLFLALNNGLVLGLAILFSFMYGAGAIFLLSWNASVIGIFIGKEIVEKHLIIGVARAVGYLPHGVFEIGAYFVGALAGGVISAAVSKRKHRTREFETIAKDALVLLAIAYALLLVGAFIEASLIVASV